jgi:hypothetical protein
MANDKVQYRKTPKNKTTGHDIYAGKTLFGEIRNATNS